MDPLIDWTFYKTRAELPDDALETLFTPLIASASAAIRGYCRQNFEAVEGVELYDGDGTPTLFVRRRPVVAVAVVAIAGETLPAGAYVWNARGRISLVNEVDNIRMLWSGVFPRGVANVSVTYTAGYAAVPDDIREACASLITFWYNKLRNLGIESKSVGKGTTVYSADDIPSPIRAILNRYYVAPVGVV